MSEYIRIRFSLALILVAIFHAVILGSMLIAIHEAPKWQSQPEPWHVPEHAPAALGSTTSVEKLQQPIPVNMQAQGELKQQARVVCPPCPPGTVLLQPSHVTPTVTTPTLAPALPLTVTNPQPPPPTKSYQLALFIGSDPRSLELQRWFTEHSGLAKLKTSCEYQVYSAANPIYQSRFASIVPVNQFPVVLFQDASGGHIHAAGRTMIPATAAELYSDLKQGYQLYLQAKQAQRTGAVKSRGYSWDEAITPTLTLSTADCPDGYCPEQPSDGWRPGDRVRDLLFDESSSDRSALMWLSSGEIATLALFGLAAILLAFILIKRGM